MLKVIISGKAGEGLNSAAVAITSFLRENGIKVEGETLEGDLLSQAKEAGMALDRLRGMKVLVKSIQEDLSPTQARMVEETLHLMSRKD